VKVAPSVEQAAEQVAAAVKPRLRGWIHAGMFPLATAASIVLVVLAPTTATTVAAAVFGASAMMLFGTSAVYHRGNWSPKVTVALLDPPTARTLLIIVWAGALAGLLARVFWLSAPRWLYVPIYVALGWVAVWFLPTFWRAENGGPAVVWLVAGGGLAYTLGAVVYGIKKPNPSPRWFGFHEIFHSLTVVGYTCHYIAAAMAIL
jgi:hemolysin III